jgi:AcrR family transcriptional regulator
MTLDLWEGVADAKRRAILAAGLKIFAQGYEGAGTRAIAAEAGVAHGLIFYYYKSKRGLFSALAGQLRNAVGRALLVPEGLPAKARLLRLLEQKLTLSAEYPEVYGLLMEQIRLFPQEYAEQGAKMRALFPWFFSEAFTQNLADEILFAALDHLAQRLIRQYSHGALTAAGLSAQGTEKARAYIAFFEP